MAILNYIFRRALRHWQLFLTLSLGVILATGLLAGGPLLVDTVTEFGLRHKIRDSEAFDSNLRLQAYELTEEQAIGELDAQVQAILQEHLGSYLSQTVLSIGSYWMIPWIEGEPMLDQRVNLRFYEGIEDHVVVVAGAWPTGTDAQTDTVPVVIGEAMAIAYELNVGDRLPLSYQRDDAQPSKWLQVSGIVRPRDPNEAYWFGEFNPLRAQSDKRWSAQYSTILPGPSFYRGVAALLPGTESQVVWHALLAPDKITVASIPEVRGRIAALKTTLYHNEKRILLNTGVDALLSSFATQAEAVRGPLYILTAEVVLLALYYVTMVAALSVQQAEREFAILRSRGASGWQIFRIQAAEAGLISAIALLSGPGLAVAMLRGITLFGPLVDVTVSDWALNLTWASWLAAGVGAAACAIGLLLPVGPTLRRSIVAHKQAIVRPPRAPWWQRFYLDVILLVVGLVLLWRLHLYGGIVTGAPSGSKVDWLLLLSPLALLLGSATILLRVFPLILRLVALITARGRGLPATLAMWQVSRNPTRVVLLVLLLTLAMSLGILSTGLNATLDVSELERAQYTVGSDMRFVTSHTLGVSDLVIEPGVRAATSVSRGRGTVDLKTYRSFPRFEVLAVDPHLLAAMGTFRDDFADQPMEELLGRLVLGEDSASKSLTLPGQPINLGIWVWGLRDEDNPLSQFRAPLRGDSDLDRIGLTAKVRTAQGEMLSVKLRPVAEDCPDPCCSGHCRSGSRTGNGRADPCEWCYFQAPLPELPPSSYPLALHSIWIQNLARGQYGFATSLYAELAFDDVMVIDAETGKVLLAEGFEDPTRIWHLASDHSRSRFDMTLPAHSGQVSQRLFLSFPQPGGIAAFKMPRFLREDELPALASPAFLEATEIKVGDTVSVWIGSLPAVTVRIVGLVQYFPTMYENLPTSSERLDAGFLVISRDPLLARLNDRTPRAINASEVWLSTDGQVPTERLTMVVPAISRIWEVETVRAAIKADPMALGLRSVTFFGYVLTSVLSIVGFATHFYMSARRREATYGILRTMGLSPRQLYVSLVLEQVILIFSGLAIGTLLGVILNKLVLPGLPITLADRPPIPPFRPYDDWLAVGGIYLVLGSALLISLAVATLLLWRARVHRILRIGEE